MLISVAMAADAAAATAPDAASGVTFNLGMIAVLFVLFYVILIRPQQKRLKEQKTMLDGLKKGDRVITSGGLIGKISKLTSDYEVEVDLGSVKVNALRYTLQADKSDEDVKADAKSDK